MTRRDVSVLDDILCERFERRVRKDNGVHFEGLVLQIPADRQRCHYVKVKVLRYTDNTLAIPQTRDHAGEKAEKQFAIPLIQASPGRVE